jgi:phosphatidylserine/phosphatidylglycerophosphate/cardiolipin synthase-like enzyme
VERADGPEIVVLVWQQATGWPERFAMGSNRDRLLRRLAAADRHGRLRAYWLVAAGEPNCEINLHAKLLIVDDTFVRIGSSNLNNRPLGVDTECDRALEASEPRTRTAIALLARQAPGRAPGPLARGGGADDRRARPIGAIERRNPNGGRLRRYRIDPTTARRSPFLARRCSTLPNRSISTTSGGWCGTGCFRASAGCAWPGQRRIGTLPARDA